MNSVSTKQLDLIGKDKGKADVLNQVHATTVRLPEVEEKPIALDFQGGALSSDAGALLLREVESQIGLIKAMAQTIYDKRDGRYVQHSCPDLLKQRIFQIACGNEDADDCDTLRYDPILKMIANRLPESGKALGSQPTMSRFENAVSRTTLYRLGLVFANTFIASYADEPQSIVLDFDDTEDTVHGTQQLTLFNGYYGEYCYMPLHVYEGLSGRLITTILKPGKRSTGTQMLAIVKRLIKHLRSKWPNTHIVFRGDGHFSYPEVMDWIEEQDNVTYATGLTSNAVLQGLAQPLIEKALSQYNIDQQKVCLFHSVRYKAGSWKNKDRRIVVKAEVTAKGQNVRFVVTNMEKADAKVLYEEIYCQRGAAELNIKDHKLYLKSDRTSCHRFETNQFRLFMHSAAYVLIHALRTNVLKHTRWAKSTVETIRLKLFKIGACVRELKTRIKVSLPTSYPLESTLMKSFQFFAALEHT